ncbi:hypothetical protein [Photorhabdus laumondii]|uniref:hypothetical protein n=1 Tax=Photorhabdus laumondii TaxID=2218628 RepID=UPI0033151DA3
MKLTIQAFENIRLTLAIEARIANMKTFIDNHYKAEKNDIILCAMLFSRMIVD